MFIFFLFLDMYYVPVQFQNMQFTNTYQEKFEDTKGVIRSRKSNYIIIAFCCFAWLFHFGFCLFCKLVFAVLLDLACMIGC